MRTYEESVRELAREVDELFARVTISLQPILRIKHPYTKETRRINERRARRGRKQ